MSAADDPKRSDNTDTIRVRIVASGQTVRLPYRKAVGLLSLGRAERVGADPKPVVEDAPAHVEVEPVVETVLTIAPTEPVEPDPVKPKKAAAKKTPAKKKSELSTSAPAGQERAEAGNKPPTGDSDNGGRS